MQPPTPPSTGQAYVWTDSVPADLKLRLLDSLSFTTVTADDLWDVIREWLMKHESKPGVGLAPTAGVRTSREPGSQKYTRLPAKVIQPTSEKILRSADTKTIAVDADQSCTRLFAEATERRRLVDLENAVIDYAAKFGVSDAARIAMGSGARK